MNKRTKGPFALGVFCLLLAGIFCTASAVRADETPEGFYGERDQSTTPLTAMDENGNTYEVEAEDGAVEDLPMADQYDESSAPAAYAASALEGYLVNFNTGSNAVTQYTDTVTGASGYVSGQYGADAAYLGRDSSNNVKFMLSGVTGVVSASKVQVVQASAASSVSYYKVSGGWLYHYVTTNIKKDAYPSVLRNGYAPSYLSEGTKYYSYDGHYFYTASNYGNMQADYKAGTRSHAVNASNPYYNYFQYLPLRSTTSYSANTLSSAVNALANSSGSKMNNIGSIMVKYQNTYGTNALLMTGVAANESGWGKSDYAVNRNNLFGLNAIDADPDKASYFSSVDECVRQFSETWMSKGYLDSTDWRYFGGFLGNKASGINVKYASDPYWGEKAAAVAWQLDSRCGGSDAGRYTIGIKTSSTDVNVRSQSSASSTVLYKTGSQVSSSVLIMKSSPENGFYRIQSDPVLNSKRTAVNTSSGNYNIGTMYAFISADYITIVNKGSDVSIQTSPFPDVNPGSWYYDVVVDMKNQGIMTGMDNGRFEPVTTLSRAHFATTLYRMAGSPSVSYKKVFPDVGDGQFYTSPVIWANSVSVITGYENGRFGPVDSLTREQMVTMLYRYAKYCGMDTSARNNLSGFPDASKVSGFAKEAMQWAVAKKIITGQGSTGAIDPQGKSSRAACAAVLSRFMALQ